MMVRIDYNLIKLWIDAVQRGPNRVHFEQNGIIKSAPGLNWGSQNIHQTGIKVIALSIIASFRIHSNQNIDTWKLQIIQSRANLWFWTESISFWNSWVTSCRMKTLTLWRMTKLENSWKGRQPSTTDGDCWKPVKDHKPTTKNNFCSSRFTNSRGLKRQNASKSPGNWSKSASTTSKKENTCRPTNQSPTILSSEPRPRLGRTSGLTSAPRKEGEDDQCDREP